MSGGVIFWSRDSGAICSDGHKHEIMRLCLATTQQLREQHWKGFFIWYWDLTFNCSNNSRVDLGDPNPGDVLLLLYLLMIQVARDQLTSTARRDHKTVSEARHLDW